MSDLMEALKAVANPKRMAILMRIKRLDIVSFSELMHESNMCGVNLAFHLKRLREAKLTQRVANPDPDPDRRAYQLYKLTPLASRLLEKLERL